MTPLKSFRRAVKARKKVHRAFQRAIGRAFRESGGKGVGALVAEYQSYRKARRLA